MTKALEGATTPFSLCCTRVFPVLLSVNRPICRRSVRLGRRCTSYDVMSFFVSRVTLPSCCVWPGEAWIGDFVVVDVPIVSRGEQAVSSQSYPTDLYVESVVLTWWCEGVGVGVKAKIVR